MPPTILCAQDDRQLCRIHEQALSGAGYGVICAHDGVQALAHAREEPPDLALLDVLLPKCDGFEVLEAIRREPGPASQVPVLLLSSGRVSPRCRERIDALGSVAFLAKPVPLDQLLGRVRDLVEPAPAAVQPGGEQPAPLEGSLREVDFALLLHQLHGLRVTGVLLLESGKKKKAIQFSDGCPVAVRSNLVTECLGDMLVRRGQLDEKTLRESLRRVKKGEGLQGEILVAMEIMDEEAVSLALREQAEEKLFEVFRWRRGRFKLQVGRQLQRGATLALDRSPADLVVEGVRRHLPVERVDAHIAANAARYLAHGESEFYRLQDIDLGREEEELVSQLDGGQRLGDFSEASEPVRRTLYALLVTEMIALRDDPTPGSSAWPEPDLSSSIPERDNALRLELGRMAETMRRQNHYEVLGIPTTADDQAVQRAYDALVHRVHPDRYRGASRAVRQLAEEIKRLASRAQESLADAGRRARYADVLRKRGSRQRREETRGRQALAAETAFQRGEAAMRNRDYEGALLFFGRSIEQFPEEGEYHAHYGWCLHLCHPDNVVIVQEAIEHVQRGVKLAREREKPYLFLGRLYKVVGKTAAAEKMFTRAVQIRPDCIEAMRELRLMNLRRGRGTGLVRRLLRR